MSDENQSDEFIQAVANTIEAYDLFNDRRPSRIFHCALLNDAPPIGDGEHYQANRKSYDKLLKQIDETDENFDPANCPHGFCQNCPNSRIR